MKRFTEEQREAAMKVVAAKLDHAIGTNEVLLTAAVRLAYELQCELTEALDKVDKLQNKLLEVQQ